MSESNQQFTEHVNRTKNQSAAAKWGWITVGVMTVLTAGFLWLWVSARQDRQVIKALRAKLDETTTSFVNAQTEAEKSHEQIADLKQQLADLEKEKEQASQMAKGLEEEMRTALESKDVTISKLQGKLTVNILDRILFDSGEAVLKPDGEAVLQKIAAFLAQHVELKIHVVGHTDNVPIRPAARSRFQSNWELSTARALAAVRLLTERAGIDPQRVGAVGYGEFRPVADNATPEGRALNRRIAIIILPNELAEADVVPVGNTVPATNSPAVLPEQ